MVWQAAQFFDFSQDSAEVSRERAACSRENVLASGSSGVIGGGALTLSNVIGCAALVLGGTAQDAINQTMSRTMLTGGTTLVALLILYFLGGEAVRGFAYALFLGIIAGTYSSIAIASPLLLLKGLAPAPEPEAKAEVKPV